MKTPTANVLSRLLWLGDTTNQVQGSGTLVSNDGAEYLVTALHVFDSCRGNPSVRYREEWHPLQWKVVAKDEGLDVIVLQSAQLPADLGDRLPVLYGIPQGAIHAQIGYSLGFPGIIDSNNQLKTDHVMEIDGRPIPIAALLVVNLSAEPKVQYSASYINKGFSGGAIVYHVAEQNMWTIAGIITHFPVLPSPVYDKQREKTVNVATEHTGLVGYVPMSAVLKMIEDAEGEG